jgi:hypothetical protein
MKEGKKEEETIVVKRSVGDDVSRGNIPHIHRMVIMISYTHYYKLFLVKNKKDVFESNKPILTKSLSSSENAEQDIPLLK